MRAVILAGGLGTRLRPYTTIIPKPLVPVGDRPILQHIIENLVVAGIYDIDLCVNYLGALIQTYFAHATALPEQVHMRWHWEREPLGTAGALTVVPDLDETFIAMNGDVLTSLDYRELADVHQQSGAALTIATQEKTVSIDLGVIDRDGSWVTGYREKPTLRYDISMGIYVYEPSALRYLPDGPCQFPDLVLRLLAGGETVAAFRSRDRWYDIGTPDEYERAVSDLALLDLRGVVVDAAESRAGPNASRTHNRRSTALDTKKAATSMPDVASATAPASDALASSPRAAKRLPASRAVHVHRSAKPTNNKKPTTPASASICK
jgi:NDP-sugar pyrophosphorylase family protein